MIPVLDWCAVNPVLSVIFALVAAATIIATAEAIWGKEGK